MVPQKNKGEGGRYGEMLLGVKQDLVLLEEEKKKLGPCVKGRRGVGNHHGVLVGKGRRNGCERRTGEGERCRCWGWMMPVLKMNSPIALSGNHQMVLVKRQGAKGRARQNTGGLAVPPSSPLSAPPPGHGDGRGAAGSTPSRWEREEEEEAASLGAQRSILLTNGLLNGARGGTMPALSPGQLGLCKARGRQRRPRGKPSRRVAFATVFA